MNTTPPVGFTANFRTFYFVAKDGSGIKFWQKASFSKLVATNHRTFGGPNITATSAASACVVTCAEAHGFHTGQLVTLHGFPNSHSALNNEHSITVTSTTAFSVPVSTTTPGALGNIGGMAGADIGTSLPDADFAVIGGKNCMDEWGNAWDHLEG